MTHFSRLMALTGLLALVACGGDPNVRHVPVPSAARGGVQPHQVSASVAEVDVSQRSDAPIASPPAVDKAAANAAASLPSPAPAAAPMAQTVVAKPFVAEASVRAPTSDLAPKLVKAAKAVSVKSDLPDVDAPPPIGGAPVLASEKIVDKTVAAAKASVSDAATPPAGATSALMGMGREYVLGTGDEIRLTVYGEDDLSGQYQIGSTGIVALPLVGNVEAAGHTISQFEGLVRDKMTKGYLKDPRVSVQVTSYRPFFILGEVAKPGSYPYVNGMSVLSAVALAGGYTYRADKGDIRVTHANLSTKEEQDTDEMANVVPGDIIRVTERFF